MRVNNCPDGGEADGNRIRDLSHYSDALPLHYDRTTRNSVCETKIRNFYYFLMIHIIKHICRDNTTT